LRLVSWNLAGWVRKIEEQVESLISREPSIICLQEVRRKAIETITRKFINAGYSYFQDSVLLAEEKNRCKGNMVVSKYPLQHLPEYIAVPHAESVISVNVETPHGNIKIHNAHIPNGSSYGWKKIETFEGIFKTLSSEEDNLRILCGDFNSPQTELPNGKTITWGQRLSNNNKVLLRKKDLRWHQGELSVIRGLAEYNLVDAFRQLHGYGLEEYSFIVRRKGEIVSKRRFDHVFASQELQPQVCVYLHKFREMKLSDHSPIEVLFSPKINYLV
jgi:exonuclease III